MSFTEEDERRLRIELMQADIENKRADTGYKITPLLRDDMTCKMEALTAPPPYQSGLPEYGYGYPYGRRASAGDGAGLLLVTMIDQAATQAWQREVYRRCVTAMGYEEMR